MNKSVWRILLVEDDEDDYILARDLLAEAKGDAVRLTWAQNYDAALQASQAEEYDICLVDYRLGRRDGLDLTRAILELRPGAPIILLTGQGNYRVDVEAMKAGAMDYLVKGEVNAPLLERTIRYAIERKQAEMALRQAHDLLEQRVLERTQELAQANQGLQAALTALRQSETLFRTLAETTSSAIFIVQDSTIRYANPAVRQITGFDPEELLNIPFWEIAHPSYRDPLKRMGLANTWDGITPARYELKVLTKTNKERWIDVTAGAMELEGRPALVITAFDITERDLAEQALRKAKSELEQRVAERTAELRQTNQQLKLELSERGRLLDQLEAERARLNVTIANAPVAIVVIDPAGQVLLSNPAAERILGSPVQDTLDAIASPESGFIFTPDGQQAEAELWPLTRSARGGETLTNVELLIRGADEVARSVLINSAPFLDSRGQVNGAVAIFQDISERKQVEDEMRRDAAQIEVQRHLIQYGEMERLHIAQDLHDGPLQELIGINFSLSDVLQWVAENTPETGDAHRQDWLAKMRDVQERLKQQIRELRIFCSDLRPPTLVPFGLEKAIRSHAEGFQDRHMDLILNLQLSADGQSLNERARLALFRIYQELLNNVVRHAQASFVQVRLCLTGTTAVLEVEDNGHGFQTPENWVEVARQGHLGLVGIQERAAAIGGSFSIRSLPGKGTVARVEAPFEPVQV